MKIKTLINNALLILVSLHASFTTLAQSPIQNISKKVSIGLSIGMDFSKFYSIESLPINAKVDTKPGLAVGLKSVFLLNKDIRLSSTLGYSRKKTKIDFSYPNGFKTDYFIRQTNFYFGQELVLKSRKKVYLPYLIFGIDFDIPIEGVIDDHDYLPMKSSVSVISGLGYTVKYDFSGLSTEIKYLLGFNDINTHGDLDSIYLFNLKLVLSYLF